MTKKKVLSFIAAIVFIAMLVAMWQLSLTLKEDGTAAAAQPFVKEKSIIIAHATDTHYYPLNYCYDGGGGNIEGTDYQSSLITGTKLFLESSVINIAGLKDIVKRDELPDYLFVTGDITLDGEIQGHIEMANILRELQNTVRSKGKTNFQVLVSFGNHDLYNVDNGHYRDNGSFTPSTHMTTRKDATKIYSSLGYPDLNDAEIQEFYDGLTDVYYDHLPYDGNFVNSTTAENLQITYQYIDNGKEANADYENGDISYVVTTDDGYVFVSFDEELSNAEINHHVGGYVYESTRDYLTDKSEAGKFDGKSLMGLLHHNTVPHFPLEDSLLKDFTVYSWRETTDFLADLGMRYTFSGHMHSNDIATHHSFNGNTLTDMETSALGGYKGGIRYASIAQGKVGSSYAETLSTTIHMPVDVDFSYLFTEGFMSDYYINFCNLDGFIKKTGNTYICIDPSEYAVTKLFYNVVNNLKHEYLRPEFIGDLGEMVESMMDGFDLPSIFSGITPHIGDLVNTLVAHLEDVTLKDYTYAGKTADFKTKVRGAKLCGFIDELLDSLLGLEVNSQGDNLFDFAMGAYTKHLGGLDAPESMLTDAEREAFNNFKNGKVVKDILDIALDENTGLYKLVMGLTESIDLTKGMEAQGYNLLVGLVNGLFNNVSYGKITADAFALDALNVGSIMGLFGMSLSLGGDTISGFINHTLDSYITGSFYTSLGEIAHDILWQFSVDETGHLETSFDGKYLLYIHDESLNVTYLSNAPKEAPSVENGKLPSMLTVTFGEDPTTDKNFVWFTDRRVNDSVIQYMEGEFDAAKATKMAGSYEMYATTTASIDLGVFSTLMHVEIGRHTVSLRNLEPGTTYSYRVGSAKFGFWSEVNTFTTAPDEDEAFELLLITDLQGSSRTTYEQVAEVMAKVDTVFGDNGYNFVINCGDVVDNSRNLVQWKYFLNIMQGYWANTTQVVSAGNHEEYAYEKPKELQYTQSVPGANKSAYNYLLLHYKLNYPAQNDTTGAYYSFDYSGVHFTVLNTNDITDKNKMSDAQIEWLKDDLESTDKKHKIVIMHKGLYSAGAHSKDADVVGMRAQLTPIFAESGVNLVLAGHDHTYSETYYLDKDGNPVSNSGASGNKIGDTGTIYITLGTLGDKFYKYVENENVPVKYGKQLHDPTLANPTFGKLVYDGEDLYYYAYEYDLATGTIREIGKGLSTKDYIIIVSAAVAAALSISVILVSIAKSRKKSK